LKFAMLENVASTHVSSDATAHSLLKLAAAASPNAVAVKSGVAWVSYSDLVNCSMMLATNLRGHGFPCLRNQLMPLLSERSIASVVGIYGILMAGGAYLPLDVKFPKDRLVAIVDDEAKCTFCLVDTDMLAHCLWPQLKEGLKAIIFTFDKLGHLGSSAAQKHVSNPLQVDPQLESGPGDLVYVMYTSGSSGKPKGVKVDHRALLRRNSWMQHIYAIGPGDVVPFKTRLTFGISEWEVFWALSERATLCVVDDASLQSPAAYCGVLGRMQPSLNSFVPSQLSALIPHIEEACCRGERPSLFRKLRHCLCVGESLPLLLVKQFHRAGLGAAMGALQKPKDEGSQFGTMSELWNIYGPTEGSITYYPCTASSMSVLVGKPIWHTVILLVDSMMRPVPVGVAGEILFGGCIAVGYLNDDKLTEDKFIPNTLMPHGSDGIPHSPIFYRSGDAGVRSASGDLIYKGRIDRQCKVRGFRIELEAVELTFKDFLGIPGGARIACVCQGSGTQAVLVLFIEASSASHRSLEGILQFGRERLPDYMIPSCVEALDTFPTLPSGKTDLKKLASGNVQGTVVERSGGVSIQSGSAVDSLGMMRNISGGQSPNEQKREMCVLNILRAFFMYGVLVDHFWECGAAGCSIVLNRTPVGFGLGLMEKCMTPWCSVLNNMLRAVGNWRCMSGFAMASAFTDSGLADSDCFGIRDVVTGVLLITWMWALDPIMWHIAPAFLCAGIGEDWLRWGAKGTLAENTTCGLWAWSGSRWYLNWTLINKCFVVGLHKMHVPPAWQCFLMLMFFLLAPGHSLCVTEEACAARDFAGIEYWWLQTKPWIWQVWRILIVGPAGIADWWEYQYVISRSYLFMSVQYFFAFHYGRSWVNWGKAAWGRFTAQRSITPSVSSTVAATICLMAVFAIEILGNSEELNSEVKYIPFSILDMGNKEWGEGAECLSQQLAALRTLLTLSTEVVLIAAAVTFAAPYSEWWLMNLAGGSTLGAYIGSVYIKQAAMMSFGLWADGEPDWQWRNNCLAVLKIVWILSLPAMLQVTIFPVFNWFILGFCRTVANILSALGYHGLNAAVRLASCCKRTGCPLGRQLFTVIIFIASLTFGTWLFTRPPMSSRSVPLEVKL